MILPIIRGNRLEGFLDGSKACPPKLVDTENGQKLNEKFEEWQVMNQILLGWLYSSLSLDVAAQMVNCGSNRELWKNVQDLVGASTKAKIM